MNNNKFERELKTILYFIRQYGIAHIKKPVSLKQLENPEDMADFFEQVHKGFYTAQEHIILNLTAILKEKKRIKQVIKQIRITENDKDLVSKETEKIQALDYQESIFRKLADTIAWQLFKNDITTVRRLYLGNEPIDITNSNIESCINAVAHYRNQNPCNFALINDITSFIQVGDITIADADNKCLRFAELKEGNINLDILDTIKNYSENGCDYYLYSKLNDGGTHYSNQFFRILRQMKNDNEVLEVLNTGQGTDLYTGENINIPQKEIEVECFDNLVGELLVQANKKGYAITVVDKCLLVGVYDTVKFPSDVFEIWAKGVKIKTPIYDVRHSLVDPTIQPVFMRFPDAELVSLVSGRKVIKMTIDIDKWFDELGQMGCSYRWLTKKQTSRINSNAKKELKIFEIDGQGIEVTSGDVKTLLTAGIFGRMFSMFVRPKSVLKMFSEVKDYYEDEKFSVSSAQ